MEISEENKQKVKEIERIIFKITELLSEENVSIETAMHVFVTMVISISLNKNMKVDVFKNIAMGMCAEYEEAFREENKINSESIG